MNRTMKLILGAAAISFAAFGATAATVDYAEMQESIDGDGNLCAGDAGSGFDNCKLIFDNGFTTPVIGKIEANGNTEYNTTSFPTLEEDELALGGTTTIGATTYNTATYTIDSDDPIMTHFAIKGSTDYTIYNSTFVAGDGFFQLVGNVYTLFYTETNMSNITVWDTPRNGGGFPPVPVPASLPLLIGALGVGGLVLKRRKRSA